MKALRIPELEGRQVIERGGKAIVHSAGEIVYVMTYDPDADGGRGFLKTTTFPNRAKRFPTAEDADAYWLRASTIEPVRGGQPNRPLARQLMAIVVDLP